MVTMKIIELIKHFMSMPTGWIILVIAAIVVLIFVYAVLTASKRADEMMEEMRCKKKKSAEKKQKYTPASLVTSALSASGITGSGKNSEIAKPSSTATPADVEKAMQKDHVKWKKYKATNRPRRKSNES
jgi:hypothetical protein